MKKKEITGLNNIRYISITLGGLNPDNVDYIYNKRLQKFYYQNSSQKEITNNDEGLKYDEQGNIINATFNKIYGTGLQIPETTFIENELNIINKIDLTQLKNSQKDLVRFYKQYLEAKQQTSEPQQPEKGADTNSQYSVLEWATIFYYADETKLLTDDKTAKARIEKFMNKHSITTTFDNFKNNYHKAKKRINEINDFPISKLNNIIPFVKENYKQAVTKIENDINFLENESDDY